MSRFKSVEPEENVTCNLIPMIDIMFLLLLFFMLSADMTQRVNEDIVLPRADEAQEDSKNAEVYETVVLNLVQEGTAWLVKIRGTPYTFEHTLKPRLKEMSDMAQEPKDPKNPGANFSSTAVMLRAEATAPYKEVQRLIQMCGAVGLYKIEVVAVNPNSKT
jgi:biopolymer transport protein ExbD